MTDTSTEASGAVADILAYHQRDEVGMTLTDKEVRDVAATLRALSAERDAMRATITEQALQYLATSGQAADAYTAQLEAEAAIDAAVLAERERCAKIADPWPPDTPSANKSRGYIAAAIRKGPTE